MRMNYKNKFFGSSNLSPVDKFGWSFAIQAILFLGTFFLLVNATWASGRINNISLMKEGDFTQVTIYADSPFEFSHSTQEAKGGKPYRLIIDCKDVVFGLPQHGYKEELPSGIIQTIRTNQFQVDPEKIVRVVLDLKGPVVYKVVETGSQKKATIAILTKQDPDFPTWFAAKEEAEEKVPPTDLEKRPASFATIETTPPTEPKTEESQVPLTIAENSFELTVSEKATSETIQKGKVNRRAVSYADTGETVLPQKKEQVSLTQIPAEEKRAKEDINKGEKLPLPIQPKPTLTEPTPEVSMKPGINPIGSTPLKVEANHIKSDEGKKDVTPSPALVTNTSSSTKQEERKSPSVLSSISGENSTASSVTKKTISRSPVPLGPYPEEKPQLAKKTEEPQMAQTVTETGKKTTTTDVGGAVKKGIGAVLGTEGASAHESDTLMESGELIQNPQTAEQGLIPERKIICYNPETKRDPFLPLTDKQNMSFEEVPLPRFENLKLVGIIMDKEGNQALLEDEIGFGYILKSGDKIKNGYVMSVEDNKVVFHVEEYGGYKVMTLELNREY